MQAEGSNEGINRKREKRKLEGREVALMNWQEPVKRLEKKGHKNFVWGCNKSCLKGNQERNYALAEAAHAAAAAKRSVGSKEFPVNNKVPRNQLILFHLEVFKVCSPGKLSLLEDTWAGKAARVAAVFATRDKAHGMMLATERNTLLKMWVTTNSSFFKGC